MDKRISPASRLEGSVLLPGDKSVSHRYAMISAIAAGKSTLHNYSTGADNQTTLHCLRSLGIEWTKDGNVVQATSVAQASALDEWGVASSASAFK